MPCVTRNKGPLTGCMRQLYPNLKVRRCIWQWVMMKSSACLLCNGLFTSSHHRYLGLGATVPTSMLREDFVRDYRENARNKIENSLVECLQICKIQAEILIIDRPDVPPALLELIKEHKITTLVMCTKNRHDWKSKTAVVLEKQADPSCNILYLHNGILVSSRHQRTNVWTSTKNKISSLGSCHFSGSSNTTTTRSSSFFNSHSTADNFGAEQLDNPSLGMNPMYIFDDNRFNAIIGLESLGTFREFISQRISTEHSRDLYQVFQTQYCDIFTRCESIGGFDSVLGVDYQNLGKDHWKYMRSWPSVLEYIVNILNTMHMQLKQNHPACDGFTHEDLLEAAKKPLNRLFTVASVICAHEVRKSPEKLFCVLNMYTSLTDATPTLRKVFGTEFISRYAEGLLAKLKDSARGIVEDLKGLILAYSSQIVVPNEGTMSLTGYIMRYICLLVTHKSSLDAVLGHGCTNDLLTNDGMNSTGRLIFWLISNLDSVLEKQSKLFFSEELKCIFLMNNTRFVLQEVDQSDVRLIVGSRWIKKRQYRIKEYMNGYLAVSWGPVISYLESAKSSSPRKRFRTNVLNFLYPSPTPLQNFAWSFNATCRAQVSWKIPCPVLRNELREKILQFIIPAYHAYMDSRRLSIRETPEDFELELKTKIGELFEG
ncbi:hypothetical protein EJB05_17915 [Eragrostis curvula]|uniref:Exocyst subunit Exo70 family protein n=1 Tax=Eragrostis curvula TaxID=38414 RepID=A0A5J9VKE0_9POAL|nr:hypothetical protein EJB05_17915 [Eragrostis curvula]